MGYDDERRDPYRGLTRRDLLQRGAAVGAILATGGLAAESAQAAALAPAKPKRGGALRVAVTGLAASQDQLNPFVQYRAGFDQCRAQCTYSRLYQQRPAGEYTPELAESAEPNSKADVWLVKLKSGVTWHDGSPFTADDVTYTYGAILSGNVAYANALVNFPMIHRVVKVDPLTVKFILNQPWSQFPIQLGQNLSAIMKDGTTAFTTSTPGTGPFMLQDWVPGTSYVLAANKNWFGEHTPYLDSVEVNGISNVTARLDGLLAGQFDAVERLDPTTSTSVTSNPQTKLLVGDPGAYTPLIMNTTAPPFNNPDVRTALKLLVDRPTLVANSLATYGKLGNDFFGYGDPLYAHDIPQRVYDPEQAQSLLSGAGFSNLTITLDSTTVSPVELSSALLFAQSAKAGGVTVNVNNDNPSTYTAQVTPVSPFHQGTPGWKPMLAAWVFYLAKTGQNLLETRWNNNISAKLINEVAATTDQAKQQEFARGVQELQWKRGGYIIWGFQDQVDGLGANVNGFIGSRSLPLGFYSFQNAWFS